MTGLARYRVRHETSYVYGYDVAHSHHLLHLVPRPTPYQQCLEHTLEVAPVACRRRDDIDAFGNLVTRLEVEHVHRNLDVVTQMDVEVYVRPNVAPVESHPWERVRDALEYHSRPPPHGVLEACRFRHESPHVRVKQLLTDYGDECFPKGRPILQAAEALMEKLHHDLAYAPGETTIATPVLDVLENRRGVCQDFAHLMIACLRSRGLAARYVSGYLRTRGGLVGDGASHAWVAVYSPPFGWIELDPTNDVRVGIDHVAIAWGRDFGDVSPLRGVILGGGTHQLSVRVTVEPTTTPQ
jgi:transglutaminase-like putative cysteine protease